MSVIQVLHEFGLVPRNFRPGLSGRAQIHFMINYEKIIYINSNNSWYTEQDDECWATSL
jgi:hypothetical protein